MTRLLCIALFALATFVAYGQAKFVPGYFITSDGKRTDCQVRLKADDKRDNPKSFEYRTTEGAEAKQADLAQVVELGLASGEVFKRLQVEMDRSPDNLSRINRNQQTNQLRAPVFATETLFLRQVVSGKATLYQYDEGNLHRFFYTMDGKEVKQLIYKRYYFKNDQVSVLDPKYGDLSVAVNEDYKQQLFNDLKCQSIVQKDIERLTYDGGKLKKLFLKYNACGGAAK